MRALQPIIKENCFRSATTLVNKELTVTEDVRLNLCIYIYIYIFFLKFYYVLTHGTCYNSTEGFFLARVMSQKYYSISI